MNAPGHLAAAYFAVLGRGEGSRLAVHIAPAWLGALLPDLVDKPAQWLHLTPYGRTAGHSVFVWGAILVLWLAVRWRKMDATRSLGLVLLGGASHLAVDLADDLAEGLERTGWVFSGWFAWPVTNPDMWNIPSPHLLERVPYAITTLEAATVAACFWHAYSRSALGRDRS